jgi:hypothetical protein
MSTNDPLRTFRGPSLPSLCRHKGMPICGGRLKSNRPRLIPRGLPPSPQLLRYMEDTITKERASAECDAVGELEVIHRLAADGIWGNSVNQWRPLAQAWLRERDWKRIQATEAAARSAARAAWFSAVATLVSTIAAGTTIILAIVQSRN